MGSAKKKRNYAPTVRDRNILNLYNKLYEIVALLAELLNMQLLTDTTVLHLSTLGEFIQPSRIGLLCTSGSVPDPGGSSAGSVFDIRTYPDPAT